MPRDFFGITPTNLSKKHILEKIVGWVKHPSGFFHVVSLNPENMLHAKSNPLFKQILQEANVKLVDGIGVYLACQILKIPTSDRLTGVDLMEQLLQVAREYRLRVMFIGGMTGVAEELAQCQNRLFPYLKWIGIKGVEDITTPQTTEQTHILSLILLYRPHILFVSFGSPYQELWIESYKSKLQDIVCMGVGGAFDFLSGRIGRAPKIIRLIGGEWLFRLIVQPWRFTRQVKLLQFVTMVIREWIKKTT